MSDKRLPILPEDGGSAFPRTPVAFDHKTQTWFPEQLGMSLRDYFAGQALESVFGFYRENPQMKTRDELAYFCYDMADAMLKARAK